MAATSGIPSPTPVFGRMMVFIDGENITMRYKAMVIQGEKERTHFPKSSVRFREDVYVWEPNSVVPRANEIIRAYYYTYSVADDDSQIEHIKDELSELQFTKSGSSRTPNHLYPVVFRKRKNAKGKGVDIQMTVDILTHVYQNNLDTVYLIAGDGDYKPVIQEAMRNGKRVCVAAFSSGLSPLLKHLPDEFLSLDAIYFDDAQTVDERTRKL